MTERQMRNPPTRREKETCCAVAKERVKPPSKSCPKVGPKDPWHTPVLTSMVATHHKWPFKPKSNNMKSNVKFCSSVSVATFQLLNCRMYLVAVILECIDTERIIAQSWQCWPRHILPFSNSGYGEEKTSDSFWEDETRKEGTAPFTRQNQAEPAGLSLWLG